MFSKVDVMPEVGRTILNRLALDIANQFHLLHLMRLLHLMVG
jgi:hypothetical protein